jgi:hypothetical protein
VNLDKLPVAEKADDIVRFVDLLLDDDETTKDEKLAFVVGYVAGISFAGGKYIEGGQEDIPGEVLARMAWFDQ